MSGIRSLFRRLRYGQPIVVVSGLPRSGTSMTMRMLSAGGLPILSDGIRTADESNPYGYYELETVKELEEHAAGALWLKTARGKAVKIISFLLTRLPETYNYQVIFVRRDLDEVVMSQAQMLVRRGEPDPGDDPDRQKALYRNHLAELDRFLAVRDCFTTLYVDYGMVLDQPLAEARRIEAFLKRRLDVEAMARAVDRALYRNRAETKGLKDELKQKMGK